MKIVCYIFHEGNLKSFKVDNLPARVSKPKIMEVKIKNDEEMIDATIEMVDGVMVVSPKVEKFEPKDGDVVFQNGSCNWVFIYKDCLTVEAYEYVSMNLSTNKLHFPNGARIGYVNTLRPATGKEKKLLFDKLKEEGLAWDAEKKELVKIEWKPKDGEKYYYPIYEHFKFYCDWQNWDNDKIDDTLYKKGMVFKTDEECQAFCNRLNDAINSVKQ